MKNQIENEKNNKETGMTNNKGGQPEKDKTVKEVLNIFNNGWNKQVILYGPPGTSKTYSAKKIVAKFLMSKLVEINPKNVNKTIEPYVSLDRVVQEQDEEKFIQNDFIKKYYKVIQFHPSYSYEDFVRGISVKTESHKQMPSYKTESKIFEQFCEKAANDEMKAPYILIIDEINRAPLASVLGELIYGLEYRGEEVYTPYVIKQQENSEKPLIVPDNLYIIGTMNTADRSIGSMDYAVRRRFAFVPVLPNGNCIQDTWTSSAVGEAAKKLFDALMGDKGIFTAEYLEDSSIDVNDIKIGHTYFLGNKTEEQTTEEQTTEDYNYLKYRIDYQIRPIYMEYIKDGLIKSNGLAKFDEIVNQYTTLQLF